MECFIAYELQNQYEERVNQMAFDQNHQPLRDLAAETNFQEETQETHEVPLVAKPTKKSVLKKQTSYGRVLIAASKAVNPILASAGLMPIWENEAGRAQDLRWLHKLNYLKP